MQPAARAIAGALRLMPDVRWALQTSAYSIAGLAGEATMSDQNSRGWKGLTFLVLGLAALGWEWSRNHDAVVWTPSWAEILMIILTPVSCFVGLRMLLARSVPELPRGIDFWAAPSSLFGAVLGLANAYFLGVWRSVSREALREFAPLLLIAGLIGAVLTVRKRRAQARVDTSQK
jgi:hypothetical protein